MINDPDHRVHEDEHPHVHSAACGHDTATTTTTSTMATGTPRTANTTMSTETLPDSH